MKFSVIIACAFVGMALVFESCHAQFAFGRVFPPYVPHMRPGLGIRNWNAFFAPFAPLGYLNMLGRKKRDAEEPQVKCTLSTKTLALECSFRESEKLACLMAPRLESLPAESHVRVVDLSVSEHVTGKHDMAHYRLVSKASGGRYSYVEPTNEKPVLISIYSNATAQAEPGAPGFVAYNDRCFAEIVEEIKAVKPENVHINLSIV